MRILLAIMAESRKIFYVPIYVHREIREVSPKVVGSNPAIPTNTKTRSFVRGAGFFA